MRLPGSKQILDRFFAFLVRRRSQAELVRGVMADVFISYARADQARAQTLAVALQQYGWSVWWDRSIVAGDVFDEVIERELDSAKSVVVLWSNASVSSEWVRNEAAVAAKRGALVPALIDITKAPLEFRRKH